MTENYVVDLFMKQIHQCRNNHHLINIWFITLAQDDCNLLPEDEPGHRHHCDSPFDSIIIVVFLILMRTFVVEGLGIVVEKTLEWTSQS